MLDEQEMDEEDIKGRVLTYHQERVSRRLTWVGIDEDRADYLGWYNNVLRGLADPPPDDWALLRAAMLHIALSESLNSEHNRWLREEIFASFEREAERHLYYLTMDTRRDRPAPQLDPEEMFPNHHMTTREATYYYSRAALAVLVSKSNPEQAIELFEELDSIFAPRMRFHLPETDHKPVPRRRIGPVAGPL